jgi:hypothetical protein
MVSVLVMVPVLKKWWLLIIMEAEIEEMVSE